MKRFHILHTNDLHSHFEQMTKIHTFVSKWRQKWCEQGEQGILLDIGDHMDRFRMETEGTDGKANRAVLEASQYDVVTLGNNEWLTFTKEQLSNVYEKAPYTVVSSNVSELQDGGRPNWLKECHIQEMDGIRFGFLAATVPYDLVYEEMGWQAADPITTIHEMVDSLRPRVDVIIMMSHLGIHCDRILAKQVPAIDLIIGSHTHHLFEIAEQVGSTLLAAAGRYGEHVGHITLEMDMEKRKIERMQGYSVSVMKERMDPQMKELIGRQRCYAEEHLSQPVAKLTEPLTIDWQQESELGNLLVDCICDQMGTRLGLVNSGVILDDLEAGIVTKQTIHEICPHPINPTIIEVKGRELRLTLEQSLLSEYTKQEIRGFGFRGKILGCLLVAGMQIEYDPRRSPYQKIQSIMIDNQPLQEEKTYKIATVDMFVFGLGYLHLKQNERKWLDQHHFLRDLISYGIQSEKRLLQAKKRRWQAHFFNRGIIDR